MDDKKYPQELTNRPIGTSTNPRAEQLQAFIEKVRTGYPAVEIQTFTFAGEGGSIGWSQIPKMVFEEIARSAKINNIQLSIHAPENDFQITGVMDRNGNITKEAKIDSAYKISAVLEAGEHMAKIYGQPIKVNMHAGDTVLTTWDKEFEEKVKEKLLSDNNYRREFAEKLYKMGFISQEQYNQLIRDNIDRETLEKNVPSWAFAKSEGVFYRINGNDYFRNVISPYTRGISRAMEESGRELKTVVDELYKENERFWMEFFNNINSQLSHLSNDFRRNIERFFENIYNLTGYAAGYPKAMGDLILYIKSYRNFLENLKEYVDIIKENIENIKDEELKRTSLRNINQYEEEINYFINNIKNYENRLSELARYAEEERNIRDISNYLNREKDNMYNLLRSSFESVRGLLNDLKTTVFSDVLVPVAHPFQEIAIENGAKNIAEGIKMLIEREKARDPQNWYKNIARYLPDIVIEESYAGAPATRPDIWKKLLNNIREELRNTIEQYPELKREIEKQYGNVENYLKYKVGATLDVGHIKMFEKYGYKKEDILKWVEEIKPEIKHLHVHETQWGTDTHLPLGLGWDEIISEELEKIKDILGNISVVHEPGGWYSGGLSNYGPEFSYYLQGVYTTNFYGPLYGTNAFTFLPYGGSQFVPQYIQYTQYSPISYSIFTQLPIDLGGGRKQQTFTGERVD